MENYVYLNTSLIKNGSSLPYTIYKEQDTKESGSVKDYAYALPSYRFCRIIFDIYIVGFLCIFGLFGNITSIIVLGKDRTMRRATAFLLQMVATADTLYLISCLCFQTFKTMCIFTTWIPKHAAFQWTYTEPYIWGFASIAQTCTVWLVVLLTRDRYIAICKPLTAPRYTFKSIRIMTFIICLSAILYNTPRFFERTIAYKHDHVTNTTYPIVVRTGLRFDINYFVIYKIIGYLTLRVLFPLSTLIYFNTRLIIAIRHSHKVAYLCGRTTSSKKDRNTMTLIVIVIIVILCEMPDVFVRIWVLLSFSNIVKVTTSTYFFNIISNTLLTLNSCINFVVYCLLGAKFRSILFRMLKSRRHGSTSSSDLHMMHWRGQSS